MARQRSFRGRSSGARRLTQWIGPADQGYVSVASGGKTIVGTGPFTEAATIIRTRGQVSIQPGSFAADLNVIGAFGVGIVSDEAAAIGVTAVPGPFDSADWTGWYVWRSFSLHLDVQSAVGFDVQSMINMEVDSKAMRKIYPNETFVLVAESQAGAFDISMPLRTLVKLS